MIADCAAVLGWAFVFVCSVVVLAGILWLAYDIGLKRGQAER